MKGAPLRLVVSDPKLTLHAHVCCLNLLPQPEKRGPESSRQTAASLSLWRQR